MNKFAIVKEFWEFLRVRKKWWLAPIVVFLLLLGGLLRQRAVDAHGRAVSVRHDEQERRAAQLELVVALHFAVAQGHMDIARLLLEYGASLEALNSYGGTVLSGTLWYMRNAAVPGVDYQAIVRELIALGARVDAFPGLEQHVKEVLARG